MTAVAGTIGVALLVLGGIGAVMRLIVELAGPPDVGGHHDFLAFWAAGRLILEGRPADLYDAAALTALQRTVIPVPVGMNGYMPFINPPFAAVLIAPFAGPSEQVGRVVWAILNAALAVGSAFWITRGLSGRHRLVGVVLIATSFPVYHALAEGQWSILLLVAGLLALDAARRGKRVATGAALGVLWLKPQFVALPLLALLAGRRWRVAATSALVGAGVVTLALPLTGIGPNLTYVGYLTDVVTSHFTGAGASGATVWRGDLASTEGLNGLLVGWFGQDASGLVNILWAGLALALGAAWGLTARSRPPGLDSPGPRAMLAAGIALVMLVNPNQFVQDCVLLFLALDALAPLPGDRRFSLTVLSVVIADLTFLDLQVPALHLFPLVLLAGVVLTCRPSLIRTRLNA